jgi:hypothetical protein
MTALARQLQVLQAWIFGDWNGRRQGGKDVTRSNSGACCDAVAKVWLQNSSYAMTETHTTW